MRVIERTMFYGASPNTFDKARLLRNSMTEAEKIVWDKLKNRNVFRARFRRQHPIGIFIVDFYCHEYKLAIEIDGEIHLENEVIEYDDGRSHDIERRACPAFGGGKFFHAVSHSSPTLKIDGYGYGGEFITKGSSTIV